MSAIHVMPVEDVREHLPVRQCWCRPTIEADEQGTDVVVHHSADGREYFEPDHVSSETPQ